MTNQKKILPGSLWLALSFLPYIISWAGPPTMGEISIPLSALTAFGLLALRILKKDIILLDSITFVYFLLAVIIDSFLEEPFFYFETGVLGYSVLAVGTFISILIRKPFTLMAAYRNFPIEFHRSPIFLRVNQIIANVWLFIFIISALCHLLLGMGISILLSNLLTIFGIISSIVLPKQLQKFLILSSYQKDPWKITFTNQEYDVAIAGAGLGGLTAAAKLTSEGKKVIVIEKHNVAGGYCSSFRKKGYYFNTGVEDVSSIFPGGVIYEFLSDLGINIGNLFYKNSSTYHLSDGRVISEGFSEKEFQQKLIEFFPNEKENIKQFFESAYKAYSQAMQGVKEYGTPLPVDIQSLIYDKKQFLEKILTHPIENPEIHLWMSSTYEEILNRFFKDPILKEFFSVRLPFTGTQLKDTDGLLALTAIVSFNLHFGHSIKGGAQAYSDSLVEYIRNHGGTVILSTPVEKVLIEDGKAKGLVTKDKIFKADAVISNVDAINTFTKLIPEGLTSKKYIRNIVNSKMSPSLLMVSLGLNMDLRDKTSLIRASGKNKIGIQILNHAGENFAPKNKSAICILSMDIIEGKEFPDRKSESYKELKQTLGDEIVQRAEKFLPGLSKSIEVMDIATPKTFERYTGMPGGALYSFYQGNKTKRPYFKTPIPGLYLASASTFPGGGVEAVTISGIIAAMDILNWKKEIQIEQKNESNQVYYNYY